MPRGRRSLHAAAASSATDPPSTLEPSHRIMRVVAPTGRNLISVEAKPQPASEQPQPALVELPARLRGTVWVRRGGFVVVDTAALGDRDNKLIGEVVAVCVGREWRRMPYWPEEWRGAQREPQSDDESDDHGGQQSRAGQMPLSDSDGDSDGHDGSGR